MKKYLIFILTIILIILSAVIFSAIFFYNSTNKPIYNNPDNNLPTEEVVKEKNAYGVKMQERCFLKLQDFIKNYGQDYSKCFIDFNFNDEYCGGFNPDTQGLSNANVIVILDSSGSMAEKIGSESRIDIAKKAVSSFLTKTPKSVNTGLIVYGHKGSNSLADKELSCKEIEEVVKLNTNNNDNIIKATNSFYPKGWTPIANSFDFAKNIFINRDKNDKNYLILVSDGMESCGGDTILAAKNIKSSILDVKLSIIGFDTDDKTDKFLREIALAGEGKYFNANNSSDIAKIFNDQLLIIKKDCINITIFEMLSRYKKNNLNNLNCWLQTQKKESDNFTENIDKKSPDIECNLEIADALVAKQKESWYKKQELEDKNYSIYKKIEADLNNQLKILEGIK